ncbi:MAG: hypothetical protein R2860_00705 [Desulfobacterales bacterium]
MGKTIIPFGPQHPVLPEPVHLTLTVEDEVITGAVPALGFVHRGLEQLAEFRIFTRWFRWWNGFAASAP